MDVLFTARKTLFSTQNLLKETNERREKTENLNELMLSLTLYYKIENTNNINENIFGTVRTELNICTVANGNKQRATTIEIQSAKIKYEPQSI